MKAQYFTPIIGTVYTNSNGTTYLCLGSNEDDNSAKFISINSGWLLEAHGCHQNSDKTIWWDSSTGKGFKFERPNEPRFSKTIKDEEDFMKSNHYLYLITAVKSSGGIVRKNKYLRSEEEFCNEITNIFLDYWNPMVQVLIVENSRA